MVGANEQNIHCAQHVINVIALAKQSHAILQTGIENQPLQRLLLTTFAGNNEVSTWESCLR